MNRRATMSVHMGATISVRNACTKRYRENKTETGKDETNNHRWLKVSFGSFGTLA
jgi:hypothetical protein